ncbi:MAG: tetratricopeptide repeat protein [Methanotrichaceae archaeon]|nr:tetratricopeptide repeat protein [Methanotrichaceae archaeon]
MDLADELGYLPLALESAGAYIKDSMMPISDYLELLHKDDPIVILQKGKPTSYDYDIATTWNISINAIQEGNSIASDFIFLFSFLAPENIPKFLLIKGSKSLPIYLASAAMNKDRFYDAIALLIRYSLVYINAEKDSIWIHRVVQASIRNNLEEKDKKRWAITAAEIVRSVFFYDRENMQSWDDCALLLPHAQAVVRHAVTLNVALEEAADLLNETSAYLLARGEVSEAYVASKNAIEIGNRILGPKHPKLGNYLHNYGKVLRVNNPGGSKEAFEKALRIDKNYIVENKNNVARDLCNIGSVMLEQGDIIGCKKAFEKALLIDEVIAGIKPSNEIDKYGLKWLSLEEEISSSSLFERALRVSEKLRDTPFDSEKAKMVIRINNLGKLLYNERYLKEAKILFEIVIEMGEKNLGHEHPNIALRINNLGRVLFDQKIIEEAKSAFEKALYISRKSLGNNHPYNAIFLNNLGSVEYMKANLDKAKDLFKAAVEINQEILGIDNSYLAIYFKNLSKVLEEKGDYEGAKGLIERASKIEEKHKIDFWASKAVIL